MKNNLKQFMLPLLFLVICTSWVFAQPYEVVALPHAHCNMTGSWIGSQPVSGNGNQRALKAQCQTGTNNVQWTYQTYNNNAFLCKGRVALCEVSTSGALTLAQWYHYGYTSNPPSGSTSMSSICGSTSYTITHSSSLPTYGNVKVYILLVFPLNECSNGNVCTGGNGSTAATPFIPANITGYSFLNCNAHILGYWRIGNGQAYSNACSALNLSAGYYSCPSIVLDNTYAAASPSFSNPSCGSYNGGDVWARFTTQSWWNGGIIINTSARSGSNVSDIAMSVYNGTCSSGTQVACSDNNSANPMPRMELVNLTDNVTYLARFWDKNNDQFGLFDVCSEQIYIDVTNMTTFYIGLGTTQTLTWNTNSTAPVLITILNSSGVVVDTVGTFTGNSCQWTIPCNNPNLLTTGLYRVRVQHSQSNRIFGETGGFQFTACSACQLLTNPSPSTEPALHTKTCHLMDQGLLKLETDKHPTDALIRQDMAYVEMKYLAGNNFVVSPAAKYPVPSSGLDISEPANVALLIMMYLKYDDQETPLKYTHNLYPGEQIRLMHFCKQLLEAMNIPPDWSAGGNYTMGAGIMPQNHAMYGYVRRCVTLGLFDPTWGNIDVNGYVLRKHAFWIWDTLFSNLDNNQVIIGGIVYNKPTLSKFLQESSYRKPFAFDFRNYFVPKGINDGIFGSYAQSGMTIAGTHDMYAYFTIMYNTLRYEYPEAWLSNTGLGLNRGWTHNYDEYIVEMDNSYKAGLSSYETTNSVTEACEFVVIAPDGPQRIYQDNGQFNVPFTPVGSSFDHYKLIRVNSTKLQRRDARGYTKDYEYLYNNKEDKKIYCLTRIRDTYGNEIKVYYQNGQVVSLPDGTLETQKRFWYVTPAGSTQSRSLTASYLSGAADDRVTMVVDNSLSPTRSVLIDYNTRGGVHHFDDAEMNPYTYTYYETPTADHENENYMLQIENPEGNITSLHFTQRKVDEVVTPNGTVTINANYNFNNSSYQTTTVATVPGQEDIISRRTISYTNNYSAANTGQTVQSSVQVGYNAPVVSTYSFTDPSLPFSPTSVTNSTYGITQSYSYQNGFPDSYSITSNGETITHDLDFNTTWGTWERYTDPLGNYIQRTIDPSTGDVTQVTNGMGTQVQTISRSANGEIDQIQALNQSPILFSNYVNGVARNIQQGDLLTELTVDGAGRVTKKKMDVTEFNYVYNNNDQIVHEYTNGVRSQQFTYTGNGEMDMFQTNTGQVTSYTYDPLTRLPKRRTCQGIMEELFWDAQNGYRLDRMEIAGQTVLQASYNAKGWLRSDGFKTIAYHENSLNKNYGLIDSIIHNISSEARVFEYDHFNRLSSEEYTFANNTKKKLGYEYTKRNETKRIYYEGQGGANPKYVDYTYDANGNVTNVTAVGFSASPIPVEINTYRNDGALMSQELANTLNNVYTRDQNNRITHIAIQDATNASMGSNEVRYDKRSRIYFIVNHLWYSKLSSAPPHNTNATYNPVNNQTTGITGTIEGRPINMTNIQYSPRGEWVSYTDGSLSMAATYDNMKNMVTYVRNGHSVIMKYDGAGTLTETTVNGLTTKYMHDTRGMSQVMIEAEDNGTVRWYYVYGARGMTARISPSGQIQYYHHNWRGDTEVMTDHTGNIIANYHYDSYGHAYDRVESTPNSFLYGGQYGAIQLDSTLIHLRGRCLDPLHRRMYQYDPVENVNGYYPMDGDPMNKVDPSGQVAITVAGFELDLDDYHITSRHFDKTKQLRASKFLKQDIRSMLGEIEETLNNGARALQENKNTIFAKDFGQHIGTSNKGKIETNMVIVVKKSKIHTMYPAKMSHIVSKFSQATEVIKPYLRSAKSVIPAIDLLDVFRFNSLEPSLWWRSDIQFGKDTNGNWIQTY